MPLLTFNVELASKPNKTGRSSVFIRLRLKGQRMARVLTAVKIPDAAKNWKNALGGNGSLGTLTERSLTKPFTRNTIAFKNKLQSGNKLSPMRS